MNGATSGGVGGVMNARKVTSIPAQKDSRKGWKITSTLTAGFAASLDASNLTERSNECVTSTH